MFNIEEELKNLPELPGVYIMHDKDNRIIYVGKAKILKNRVRQYFQNTKNHSPKVRAMVSNIDYFEYIVTDSETEALVLECTLIKKHKPKYNILLKDDKHYPYIKVTINEDWPKIFMTRTLKNDGSKYFGPYMGMSTVKNTLDIVQKIFIPPTCNKKFPQDIGKGRPCLNYHIKNCFAPCMGNITQEEYKKVYMDICEFLDGDHKNFIKSLEKEMKTASDMLNFEKAAGLRDKIKAITAIDEKQKVLNSDKQNDKDVISFVSDEKRSFVSVFTIRKGRLSGRENYRLDNTEGLVNQKIMTDFIKQFYQGSVFIPDEIITQYQLEDIELIENWLAGMKGKKVTILNPKRGEKVRLLEMVKKNAEIERDNYNISKKRYEEKKETALKTGKLLGLDKVVRYIEAYDISNISGEDNVASMVVFENGNPKKSRYRKFRIKSFEGADDYRAMQEVLFRRLNEAREEQEKINDGKLNPKDAKFLPLPDVIFVDGGKGHIASAEKIMEITETDIPVFGMVKDDKHKTRGLLSSKGEIGLNPTGEFFRMITRIQDEVHRTAISYHRNLHEKISSELDNIKGIGEVRKKALLSHFKSIENIKNAKLKELLEVKGMDKKSAGNVIKYFKNQKS